MTSDRQPRLGQGARGAVALPPREAPRAIGASVAGDKHIRALAPNQDAWHQRSGDGCLAVAVADGHGSCARADLGARLAAQVTTGALLDLGRSELGRSAGTLRDALVGPAGRILVHRWQRQVAWLHGRRPPRLDVPVDVDEAVLGAHGTTLLAALVTPTAVATLAIGDGDLLCLSAEGEVSRPLGHDPRAFASETPSLGRRGAWRDLRVAAWQRSPAPALLLLMTDGYTTAYPDDAALDAVARGYRAHLEHHGVETVARHLPGLLRRVSRTGSGDDVTLVLGLLPGVPG